MDLFFNYKKVYEEYHVFHFKDLGTLLKLTNFKKKKKIERKWNVEGNSFLFIYCLMFFQTALGCFYPLSALVVLVTPITTALLLPIYYVGTREVSSGSMLLLLQEEQLMIA